VPFVRVLVGVRRLSRFGLGGVFEGIGRTQRFAFRGSLLRAETSAALDWISNSGINPSGEPCAVRPGNISFHVKGVYRKGSNWPRSFVHRMHMESNDGPAGRPGGVREEGILTADAAGAARQRGQAQTG
jgi:hypothetical protein